MSSSSLSGQGRFTPGIADKWWKPRIHRPSPPVIFMTGGDGTALYGAAEAQHIVDALVAANYTVVMPSVPYMLGNATAVSRITDAVNSARSVLGCTNDPPILIGQSNGGVCALNYARQNTVAGIVGLICPVDLETIYEDDILGLRSVLGTAWGVTYPTPLPSNASPLANVNELSGVQTQLWEASDDPLAVGVAGFSTTLGADLNDVGELGHTAAAVQAVDAQAVMQFVLSL